ncbi:MAG: efflux RND transporter periplasmic adaptor subunit, partial [Cyanobacteriota bacterium]
KIKASLIKDEKNLNRVQELVQQDFISHSSYDQALSTRDNSIAELKAKEAMLKKAKLNLSYTKIYAPINGKIGSLMVTEGNLVGPDTGSMATIVKLNPIYVTYNIPADDFTKLRLKLAKEHKSIENHQIELILSDGAPYAYKGTQDFFDNKIDETTGTIKLRARFPNPDGILLPGQLCNIIVYSNKPVIKQVLPQSAILEDTAGKFVYIVTKEKTVQRQGIETGRQIGKDWVIKDGIEPDDQVISTGLQKIKHGMSVNILSDQTNNADSKGSH